MEGAGLNAQTPKLCGVAVGRCLVLGEPPPSVSLTWIPHWGIFREAVESAEERMPEVWSLVSVWPDLWIPKEPNDQTQFERPDFGGFQINGFQDKP